MMHFTSDFLDANDKIALCLTTPIISCYAALRLEASLLTTSDLTETLLPLDHSLEVTSIDATRSRKIATILLLCDFSVGELIRFLGGNYTGNFIDYPQLDHTLSILESIPPHESQPRHNFKALETLYHQGAPLRGVYSCSLQDMLARNIYDNHSAARPHYSSIHPLQKSYAIALPRWTLRFIDGLFLAAIGWATRLKEGKIKGRQVNKPLGTYHISSRLWRPKRPHLRQRRLSGCLLPILSSTYSDPYL